MSVQSDWLRLLIEMPTVLWDRTLDILPDSPAHVDMEEIGRQAVLLVLELSRFSLEQSRDHMLGLARVLDEEQPRLMFPGWVLARAALEAVARASWILDPKYTGKIKASKALMLYLKDLEWQGNMMDQNQLPKDIDVADFRSTLMRERELAINIAKDMGVTVEFSKRDNIERIGNINRISPTNLIESVLDLKGYYAILSQPVHATANAMYFDMEGIMDEMVDIIYHIIQWFSQATWWYFEYYGIEYDSIIPNLESIGRRMQFPDEARFWDQKR